MGKLSAKWIILGISMITLIAICIVGLILYHPDTTNPGSKAYQPSVLGNYSKAAVAIDGKPCAKIGVDVLQMGGTAMDSVIASLFCNGVYNSQSMGIGGGFLMTYYNAKEKKAYTLDAREKAPLAATNDMFKDDPEASQFGPLSVAVPGELAGYWAAKTRFGNPDISWQQLIQPTIDMCRNGITVSWTHANTLASEEELLIKDPKMREVLVNPLTGRVWQEGDVYTRPDFADTLEQIAKDGDAGKERFGFYTGPLGEALVKDVQELGGILTMEDLKQYQADWNDPIHVNIGSSNVDMYTVPPPGSGVILGFILNILDNFNFKPTDDKNLMHQRIVEAFKWAYAERSILGDPSDEEYADQINELLKNITSEETARDITSKITDVTFNNATHYGADFFTPDDHGTAHVSILAENGDAVSVTSTINLYFGSKLMSKSTGIILNDEMDDFSSPNITNYFGVPPSKQNFIKPGKRPLSSMCPAILVNSDGSVRMVIGAAGGTKITTATAISIIHNLWLGDDIKRSIDTRRLHHQLAPMVLYYEPDFNQEIKSDLESRGHKTELVDKFGSVVVGIAKQEGRVYANADFRKAGGVDGY